MTAARTRVHAFVEGGRIVRPALLTPGPPGSIPAVSPFSAETHSTTAFNGIAALIPADGAWETAHAPLLAPVGAAEVAPRLEALSRTLPAAGSVPCRLILIPLA